MIFMLPKAFYEAADIIEKLEKHGYKAYFVGGCVRDLLLDRPIGDIDIATSAKPGTVQKLFQTVIPVGIEHGTVIVRHNRKSYEVTTFRLDGAYSDRRRPDTVHFTQTIEQDLMRRDFTINALAMNIKGEITDPFAGKRDLEHEMIRTVGDGFDRFHEDPLRIIRALRFSSQLGFQIEANTLQNMTKVAHEIEHLAIERIVDELAKLFAGSYIKTGIYYLKYTKLHHHIPVLKDDPSVIDRLPVKLVPLYSLGEVIAMFHYIEPDIDISTWTKNWKCANRTKHEAMNLSAALFYFQNNGLNQWLVYRLDDANYNGFVRLAKLFFTDVPTIQDINRIKKSLPIRTRSELALNGYDIKAMFPSMKGGPWIRDLLQTVEKKVVNGTLANNKSALKEWIKWNPPDIN